MAELTVSRLPLTENLQAEGRRPLSASAAPYGAAVLGGVEAGSGVFTHRQRVWRALNSSITANKQPTVA